MTQHTPGPWWTSSAIQVRCGDRRTTGDFIADCMGDDAHQSWVNARLIAAAPDLLAALDALLEAQIYADGEGLVTVKYADTADGEAAVSQARAAIAKAKGE